MNRVLAFIILLSLQAFAGNIKYSAQRPNPDNNTSVGPRWDGTIRTSIGTGKIGQGEGGDVSTVSITEYSPRGQAPDVGIHLMPWFSCSGDCYNGTSDGHTEVDYASDDPAQVAKQIDSMIARGISYFNIDWYGQNNGDPQHNATTLAIRDDLDARFPTGGGSFTFNIDFDGGAIDQCVEAAPTSFSLCHCPNGQLTTSASGNCVNASGTNITNCSGVANNTNIAASSRDAFTASTDRVVCALTNEILWQMKYINDQFYSSPNYTRYKARSTDSSTRPVLFFFSIDSHTDASTACNGGTTACSVDPDWNGAIASVRASATYGDPIFLFRKRDGLTHDQNNGAFGWSGCGGDGTVTNGSATGTVAGCAQEHKAYDPAAHPATYKTPANNGDTCTTGCTTKTLSDPYSLVHLNDTNNKTNGMTSTATSSVAQYTSQAHNDKPNVTGWWAGVNNRLTPWGTTQRKLVFWDNGIGLMSTWKNICSYWGKGTGTVNVNGTAVTWASGDQFLQWSSDSSIVINGTSRGINAVTSPTALTLDSSGGTLTNVSYTVNSGLTLKSAMGQSLNDFDEGHGMEGGVTSGLSVSAPSLSGSTISWTVSGKQSLTWCDFTTKNTAHHIEILGSQDGGTNTMKLVASLDQATTSYDLRNIGLDPGVWLIYVKVVGQPLLKNAVSSSVSYTQRGGQPRRVRRF